MGTLLPHCAAYSKILACKPLEVNNFLKLFLLRLTQKDIATRLNITDRAVSKWERGICAPDLALLEPLAEILEISITELITGEAEVTKEHKEELTCGQGNH